MKLVILTDEIEPWFQYIWEQFAQINSLKTTYNITTYIAFQSCKEDEADKSFILEYAAKPSYEDTIFIPKRKTFKTDDYVWIRDDLPIYKDTIAKENEYDIFYNAFVHLSRLEEWESEQKGKYIYSYSCNHPRKNKMVWKIPVVNYLFNELENKIKMRYPEAAFDDNKKPVIEFSHDVDYIYKTCQLRIKQTAFNLYNCFKSLLGFNFNEIFIKFKKSLDFAIKDCDYWCFDCWEELEKKLNIKSVYYFFAKPDNSNLFNLKQWLIDPSYNISKNERLKNKCKELISNGHGIGMHGSYFSANHEELFRREKEILETSINNDIIKSRQHWLNYYEGKTPYIFLSSGIKEDSTLGFNDIPGFRAGIASKYNPYDHKNKKAFSFKEIPFVLADSHLYDYSNNFRIEGLQWLFEAIDKVKNFAISLNWHQRAISYDYQWENSFKKIAEEYINRIGTGP